MGANNAAVVRECERTRKAGDAQEFAEAEAKLVASQQACEHLKYHSRLDAIDRDSVNGKYKKGGFIKDCSACSAILEYIPPAEATVTFLDLDVFCSALFAHLRRTFEAGYELTNLEVVGLMKANEACLRKLRMLVAVDRTYWDMTSWENVTFTFGSMSDL